MKGQTLLELAITKAKRNENYALYSTCSER